MKSSHRPSLFRHARSRRFVAIALCAVAWLGSPACRLHAAGDRADVQTLPPLSFTLKDQFGREYTEAYCAGKTSILMIYDREGGKFGFAWGPAIGRELRATAAPPTQWINVTTLTYVPAFLRGTAAKYLPRDPAQWTLLDFHGQLSKTYHISADHLGIVVCGPDGRVVFCTSVREIDPGLVSSIVAAIAATRSATTPLPSPK